MSAPAEVSIGVVLCSGDRGVLETFYWATGGDGWVHNEGWLKAEDLADWYGIDAEGDCVTRIRLDTNGLRGTLPWELGSLEELGHLPSMDRNSACQGVAGGGTSARILTVSFCWPAVEKYV